MEPEHQEENMDIPNPPDVSKLKLYFRGLVIVQPRTFGEGVN